MQETKQSWEVGFTLNPHFTSYRLSTIDTMRPLQSPESAKKVENINSKIRALTFLPGEPPCIVSGEQDTAELRHLTNRMMGKSIGSSTDILAVAATNDGKWVIIGTTDGFTIWNSLSGQETFVEVKHHAMKGVRAIDTSLDSKWVVTGTDDWTVDLWDVSTGERRPGLGTLRQEYNVVAVKFCPCARRIATATLFGSVRIYSTNSWQKLLTIPISVMSTFSDTNITLAWFADRPQIFAVSQAQIKCLNSNDGTVVYQWPTRGISNPASVTLSSNYKFIAYSVNDVVVVRDTASGRQIGEDLKHDENVSCIAFSPKNDLLVVGADTKYTVWDLGKLFALAGYTPDAITSPRKSCVDHHQDTTRKPLPTTFSLPLMNISNGAVKPWLHSFLEYADEVLSTEIDSPTFTPNHNTLANRALIRGRLGLGTKALADAEKSLVVHESAIGHIAKTISLIHLKKYDLAKQEIHKIDASSSNKYTLFLKVIQSILFCLSGEYQEQIDHVVELSKDSKDRKLLLLVQANMHLSKEEFDRAAESFKKAHVPNIFPHEETPEMWSVSFIFGWKFSGLGIQIQQRKCQFLLDGGKSQAADLYLEVTKTYQREFVLHIQLADWSTVFRRECRKKLELLGDKASESGDYEEAIKQYTAVEPLIADLDQRHTLFLKRSKAHVELGPNHWNSALLDADEAIKLNQTSPWGHERRYIVLNKQHHYHEAAEELNRLVQCLMSSRDPKSIELRERGVDPEKTKAMINNVINDIFKQPRPHVLVHTKSGSLCDNQKQTEVFIADDVYKGLILSPKAELDGNVAWREDVRKYFRYSTFSHTWEGFGEPDFRKLEKGSVQKLDETFPNKKLQSFCEKTREHGYWWAWSDTCCINKDASEVLNMSLRSMYQWYSGSSLTIVHLKGVFGALDVRFHSDSVVLESFDETILRVVLREFIYCRWNQRAWTLQEYFASKAIHFYTEDWKPYLPIDHYLDTNPVNHKSYSIIRRAMQLVTGVDADRLASLKPGADDARQKLSLASKREAMRKEDMAYSLLGIFKVTIDVVYGDDEVPRVLGRLLGVLLTKSTDVTILAWTGKPSEYNSCLPAEITVYHEAESLHVPNPIEEANLAASIQSVSSSLSPEELAAAVKLHDNLLDSPPPELNHGRLKLPCIWFPLGFIDRDSTPNKYIAMVPSLGRVEIETTDDLSAKRNSVLVHPWFRRFLDPEISMIDSVRQERAKKLLAAFRQPFGALLLAQASTSTSYERVATDNLIKVQIREDFSPEKLLENFRVLYIT